MLEQIMILIASDYNKNTYCKNEFTIDAMRSHGENYNKYSCNMDEFLLDFSMYNHNCNHKDCYYKIEKPCTFNINGKKNISDSMDDKNDYCSPWELEYYDGIEDIKIYSNYTINIGKYTFIVNKKIIIFCGILLGIALNIKSIIN